MSARYVVEYVDNDAVSYFVVPRSRKPGTKFRTSSRDDATRLPRAKAQAIAARCNAAFIGVGMRRTASAVEVRL